MLGNGHRYSNPETQVIANRNRLGNGVGDLMKPETAPTHHIDSLQRFSKDFASLDREKRQKQLERKQMEIEKKRLAHLQRENQRWEKAQQKFVVQKQREYIKAYEQVMGQRKAHNTNGKAYNPINLSYDNNEEGMKLKRADEDRQIRRYVRARNMDDRGNCKYDLLSGRQRVGIQSIVPEQLNVRFNEKLSNHYQNLKIRAPTQEPMVSPRSRYY